MSIRIENKFKELKAKGETAFVSYICAGDPDYETSSKILHEIANHSDIIELGIPFSDPAGDGPVIEEASKRAIANGMTLQKTLQMATEFGTTNDSTPLILMGYYNSFLKYGLGKFFTDAKSSGVDGLIIVDLPLEERHEIYGELKNSSLSLINLISPLSSEERIKEIVDEEYSSGFLYLVSMLGITGTKDANPKDNGLPNQLLKRNISPIKLINTICPAEIFANKRTKSENGLITKAPTSSIIAKTGLNKYGTPGIQKICPQ